MYEFGRVLLIEYYKLHEGRIKSFFIFKMNYNNTLFPVVERNVWIALQIEKKIQLEKA